MEDEVFNNMEIKENCVIVSVNPKIYPLEVIQSAAYILIDRVYVVMDGDPEEEIFVQLIPKETTDLQKLAYEFNNELLNYAVYHIQSKRNKEVRDAIVKRVFLTNNEDYRLETDVDISTSPKVEKHSPEDNTERLEEEMEKTKDIIGYEDDPLGIAQPWTPEKAKGLKEPDDEK